MQISKINPRKPSQKVIEKAARIIRDGGLVAFPTETVYGLGASALNAKAVRKIFAAKGRPLDNPIIVHVTKKDLHKVVVDIPLIAKKLIDNFWPGPLTLILKKRPEIPDEVTAGLKTVAVRCPSDPTALALIKAAGPIAAPSANKSGRPSPTTAQHVVEDLGGKVDLILDGGKTAFGLESTVFDVKSKAIVRPGPITLEQIRKIVNGAKQLPFKTIKAAQRPISPGLKYRHYAPRAKLILFEGASESVAEEIENTRKKLEGKKVAIIATAENKKFYFGGDVFIVGHRCRPTTIARNLFSLLRKLDEREYEVLLCEGIKEWDIGAAIMNRLRKAASTIIKCEGKEKHAGRKSY